jgi:hypothetical protein
MNSMGHAPKPCPVWIHLNLHLFCTFNDTIDKRIHIWCIVHHKCIYLYQLGRLRKRIHNINKVFTFPYISNMPSVSQTASAMFSPVCQPSNSQKSIRYSSVESSANTLIKNNWQQTKFTCNRVNIMCNYCKEAVVVAWRPGIQWDCDLTIEFLVMSQHVGMSLICQYTANRPFISWAPLAPIFMTRRLTVKRLGILRVADWLT